jgi:adenylate kinase
MVVDTGSELVPGWAAEASIRLPICAFVVLCATADEVLRRRKRHPERYGHLSAAPRRVEHHAAETRGSARAYAERWQTRYKEIENHDNMLDVATDDLVSLIASLSA